MISASVIEITSSLKKGNVIAYPTEAVWGLGCDPYNKEAFEKLLLLKRRPLEKGVILLASNIEQVEGLLKLVDVNVRNEIVKSWQESNLRATTWILPTDSSIPEWITGKHNSVAVRVTQHFLCQNLCQQFGGFIVSTSANVAGQPPALTFEEAYQYFKDDISYFQGHIGQNSEPSRIIDAITGQTIRA